MIAEYRRWYEHERFANDKMICMIESVPRKSHNAPSFIRAVNLAGHLAACRENWLMRLHGDFTNLVDWWPVDVQQESLRTRYASLEAKWTEYLGSLSDDDLSKRFEFPTKDGKLYRWSVEGQLTQLMGHAFYHRAQIALLVDEMGGITVDTDYLYWEFEVNPEFGPVVDQ
jgi:uncharacterized damage-inducible protein DinB